LIGSKPRIELQFFVPVNMRTLWKRVDLLRKKYFALVSRYKILVGGATEIDQDARTTVMTGTGVMLLLHWNVRLFLLCSSLQLWWFLNKVIAPYWINVDGFPQRGIGSEKTSTI